MSTEVTCSTELTFDQKVKVMMKFFGSIGPRKSAEFTVRLDESIEGLRQNNEEFVKEFQRLYKP